MLSRKSQNLPAVQSSTAIAIVAESGAALVAAGQVPKAIQRGVLEIMLAFPAQGMADSDRRIVRDLYLEAVEDHPRAVVEWTLKYLVFNNPRNTPTFSCAPTPQDVREACRVTDGCWHRWVVDYYFGGEWAKPSTNTMLTKENADLLKRHYEAQKRGKPGEPNCLVPEDLQIHYLRREIERQLPDIENEEKLRAQQYADPLLLMIKDDVLDRMPAAAFPDGALEMVRSKRAARAEAARKAVEHEAYINSLSAEVRAVRWTVVTSDLWRGKDETEIMAETNRRLEIIHTGRAKAEADAGEFTGCAFDDGTEWHERDFQRFYRRGPRRA